MKRRREAPPSGLPAISPTRGEIGCHAGLRQSSALCGASTSSPAACIRVHARANPATSAQLPGPPHDPSRKHRQAERPTDRLH
ncbi:hypothetical protein EN802_20775 [bacterium M00.F.Ca.ET.159.01.1.1]|nr:hypothetical protein EN802_20775 [bacterium M00.F.Ca.ET.159.01.1.1]TGT82403.1 hypothetical protein EN800_18935 [bacterium M00.F.Ca.ET.157.01.1.1]